MDRFLQAMTIFGGGYAIFSFLLVYFLGPKKEGNTDLPSKSQSESALEIVQFAAEMTEKHSPDDTTWAVRFLKDPHPALDGKPPIDFLATPDGRRQIKALLKARQYQPLEKP